MILYFYGCTSFSVSYTHLSGMIGAGSLAHNRRDFIAENVDPDRVHLNICYQNENLKDVYKELFDDSVERYNVGKRKDRQITNYYEKIRQGKQEKLFHEVIFQIGNCEDMAVGTVEGELAVKVLNEYMQDFQKRLSLIHISGLRRRFVRANKLGESVNPLSLAAYQAAYEKGGEWLDQLQDYLDANFEFAVKYIRENLPGAVCEVSQATYLLWVDMNGCGIDTSELSKFFAKSAGLLVESGNRLFVSNAAGFVRVNLAMPRALVAEGLERMAAAVREERRTETACS